MSDRRGGREKTNHAGDAEARRERAASRDHAPDPRNHGLPAYAPLVWESTKPHQARRRPNTNPTSRKARAPRHGPSSGRDHRGVPEPAAPANGARGKWRRRESNPRPQDAASDSPASSDSQAADESGSAPNDGHDRPRLADDPRSQRGPSGRAKAD